MKKIILKKTVKKQNKKGVERVTDKCDPTHIKIGNKNNIGKKNNIGNKNNIISHTGNVILPRFQVEKNIEICREK